MKIFKRAFHLFFFVGIFLLPFNSDIPKWFGFLGEYSADSSPMFFLISFVFLLFYFFSGGKLYLPIKNAEIFFLVIFALVLLASTAVNIPEISNYYFKRTSGFSRFFRQLASFLLSAFVFFLLFLNVCKNYGPVVFFKAVRKIMLISLFFVFSCAFLEYLIVNLNLVQLTPLYRTFDYLPFVKTKLDFRLHRISSLTYEPPALGTYLLTITSFMFSYIFTSKRKYVKFIPTLCIIFLTLASKSRTALIVVFVELFVGVLYAYLNYEKFRKFTNRLLVVGLVFSLFVLTLFWKSTTAEVKGRLNSLNFLEFKFEPKNNSISNKSRLGIQYALLKTFEEQPIFGTGWGQQAFKSRFKYPEWATKNNYEFREIYLNEKDTSFPPGYNLYLRILTETGLMGFIAFLLFLTTVVLGIMALFKKQNVPRCFAIALIMALPGYFLNWFQIDSFRIYGFWLCLAILILLKKNFREPSRRLNSTLQ